MRSLRRATALASAALALVAGVAPACSSGRDVPAAAGAGNGGGGPLFGGTGGADAGSLFGGGARGSVLIPDGAACVAEVRKGEALPLDMYVLLDRSASMLEPTASGPSKWDAIRVALESFVSDAASSGLSVGLQYFPLMKDGVPPTCTTHAQCGSAGPCFITACDNRNTLVPCATAAECGVGGQCLPFGGCDQVPPGGTPAYCAPIGSSCGPGYGKCLDFGNRWCLNAVDCASSSYATPAVPIIDVPGGSARIVDSIRTTTPDGRTPTGPALLGAISQAGTWAKAHPGHKVVAVLATDGLPTECTPQDITQVGGLAKNGFVATPSISTFVIGVFGPADVDSPANLDTIAAAGGTGKAFIVDTSGNVTKEFQAALAAIRGSALLSCELKLPPVDANAKLSYSRVNLQLSPPAGAKQQLVYVTNAAGCASAPGIGWYYDVDPASGGTPTRISVCPDVCRVFQQAAGASLNLQIGCQTIVR